MLIQQYVDSKEQYDSTGGTFAHDVSPQAESAICTRFEAQAERFADRVALNSAGRSTTYSQLNMLANTAAHAILNRLGESDQTAALLTDQGLPLTTAIMGSLKAGRSFVPLDPSYPETRIAMMLEDSDAGIILTQDRHLDLARQLTSDRIPIINIDRLDPRSNTQNPGLTIDPGQLAYILYTSGSTGKPKGVMQDQRSVLHNMLRHREIFSINEFDRQTLLYPCSVYGGIRDIFNALLNGAALYHYPVKDAGTMGLKDWLRQNRVTIYCSVATVFRHFARELKGENLFPDLRFVKLGGEAPYRADIELFREHFGSDCGLLCGLGSTETGISRKYVITPDTPLEGTGVPLGYPVMGMDIMLLDEDGKQVAKGEFGEIAIRSRYIMQGYHGRLELNSKVLLEDTDQDGTRLFMTGDMGQIVGDNCLIHRGRKDHQVKIRGNRVELPEIETALTTCEGVRDAIVVAKPNHQGDMSLIAYIVPNGEPGPTVRAIRGTLLDRLPHFMIPNTFVRINAIPQTPNGKTDRLALPDPDSNHHMDAGVSGDAPHAGLETKIAEAWKKVLGLTSVGATDSFFDLGGDSLMAVQLVLEVERSIGKSLPVSVFYHTATIREMAAWLSEDRTQTLGRGVIRLHDKGTKPPLFFLPGRGGTAFSFRGLAALLNDDRPVFAMQYPGLENNETPIDNVEELAAEFVDRIRKAHPDGPVLLAGYSFGGLLAFEAAQQLRTQGVEVPYLGLLDTMTPDALRPRPKLERLLLHLRGITPASASRRIRDTLVSTSNRIKSNTRLPHQSPAGASGQHGQISQALERLSEANKTARENYKPRPYDGDLSLFQTTVKPDWMRFVTVEQNYGWDKLVTGQLRTYLIPGSHLEIFDTAHAVMLAEQVRASLNPA